MAVSRALRRLLRIRDIEEEQSRLTMEAALGDLHKLEGVRASAVEQDHRGRRLVQTSAHTGELPDRLAGLEDMRAADRLALALALRIAGAQEEVAALREDFLARRVARRQAETLIQETEALDAIDANRRSQQALDDWFRNRLHRLKSQNGKADRSASMAVQQDAVAKERTGA